MSIQDIYLLCFAVGALWSLAALLLGGIHAGHSGDAHVHVGHAHTGQAHVGHPHLSHGPHVFSQGLARLSYLVNPSCGAIFLAWFGGIGYLLARHTGLGFWIGLLIATALGLTGAWILASFLRFLNSRERPLDPAYYEVVGVLGRISSPIHAGGVGELIYVQDGARRSLAVRSEDGHEINRGEEVVVTRYEKGIAYVRTWEAMTR